MIKKGHHIKAAKTILALGMYFTLAAIVVCLVPASGLCGTQSNPETAVVLQAARKFLDAEVRKDYPVVYACFAPSSSYVRSHSYNDYLVQAQSSPDQVIAYRIIAVSYIQNNKDKKTYPAIEKFAQVEVEVTFLHIDTQQRSEANIGFIFFKEQGRWYKS